MVDELVTSGIMDVTKILWCLVCVVIYDSQVHPELGQGQFPARELVSALPTQHKNGFLCSSDYYIVI
jgi:hypothetical protein